jgi:enoyl-CoA hydratase/carnithine racemase
MSERVKVEIDGPIAHVRMTRADKMNGLDMPMMHALIDAAKQIERNRSVRAVVLSGDGRAFCAGLDFASVGKNPTRMMLSFLKVPRLQKLNIFQRVCWVWRDLPVPVVAAIHGACYGGGMQIALACDFRVAAPDAELSIMEAKWGLVPDMTGSVTLRELVPIDVAKRLTMTAEVFDGNRAAELGLVTEVADDPQATAVALAEEVSARSPDQVAATKRLFHKAWTASERKAFWVESYEQLRLLRSKNHARARKSGGRPDSWSDRQR